MKKKYKLQVRLLIGIFLSVLFLCSHHLEAQTRFSESFNYASGTTLSNTSWVNISGTPLITVADGNLAYPNTIATNMGNKVALTSGGQNVYKSYTAIPLNNTDGLAAYASMVVNVSAAQLGNYFFALGNSASAHNARIYIQANGSGYSFGIGKTAAAADYETTVRPFGENVLLVLKYEAYTGTNNDIIRLYVNPPLSVESPATAAISIAPAIADVTSLNHAFLLQGAVASSPTLEVDGINIGDTWSSVTSAIFDYGDVPASYEFSKDGVYMPAAHARVSGFYLGITSPDRELAPNSVAPGGDNNGVNGDGVEEDAINPVAAQIRKRVPYTLNVSVTNTTGTKYLYGWVDFNNNGKFEVGEFATVSFSTTGVSTQALSWTGLQTGEIPDGVEKLYMRLRLSDRVLNDFTTAAAGGADLDERSIGFGAISTSNVNDHGTIPAGEVEDYQVDVVNTFDYGDLPVSFENDKDDNYLPALHAPLEGFSIGDLLDVETVPASVTAPDENNIAGDNVLDLEDEDGITEFLSVSRGVAYSISVPVNIPATLTGTKYLYGWLDLNGDGRFQLGEVATATTTLTGNSYMTLTWSAAQTNTITPGTTHIYARLRLSNLQLQDFTTAASGGATIDERSIGNGATATGNSANNPIVAFGEVEDYQLTVDKYDFGDVPVSYEDNNAGNSFPARQIASSSYRIGQLVEDEYTANSVLPGADNNGTNGDGEEEDGVITLPSITKGAPFSFTVPVTVAAASSVIAWIDFNNDGRFQASEVAYTAVTGTTSGYQTGPIGTSSITFWFRGAQTALIPPGTEHLYVRIRLTQTAGADNASTTDIDERSIADGANTGIYAIPRFGEVEDYRFEVADELYDFGDAPESYEMDKDGTAPANFKPARNYPTNALHLGNSFDLESGQASVAPGADNNGTNGDGITDDGLAPNRLFFRSGAANSFVVSVTNNTGAVATLYGWIDLNNNGRFEAGEVQTVSVANGATSATLTFSAAQINSIDAATHKLYMRLRLIQPETGVTIADFTTAAQGGAVVDERAIADGLITGEYGAVSRGEVEDYQLTVIRDYGDVPVSYENGNPAYHTNAIVPELMIGATVDYELAPNSVASGADNNGLNGDGADEDGISIPQTITDGSPFSVQVPINTTVAGTKYLYAWIDLNGDGVFNGNEVATASGSIAAGTTTYFTLTWNNINVDPSVLAEGKTYVRFRLSGAALTNSNSGNTTLIDTRSYGGSNAVGEIEDYQFDVGNQYDYGDAPVTYDMNKFGTDPVNYLPARQSPSPLLRLGLEVETESTPNSVAPGADNNGANGDGLEEDGLSILMPVHRNTTYYARVSVMNNTGSNKILYGWIDFNNDGRFQASEVATFTVPSNAVQQTVTLSWTAANTNLIPVGVDNVYMRLRISAGTLGDWTTAASGGAVVDERAIGDGLAGTAAATPYGVAQIGEIEDYRLPVASTYDYGDLPDSYDLSRNDVLAPARQAISSGLYIGDNPADAEATKLTSTDALGDDQDGIDDEDGLDLEISPIYAGGGAGYVARVKVTNFTGAARTLYGWIDFNNDGRFQATEMASVSVPNNTNGGLVTLTWTNAQSVFDPSLTELNMRLRISEGTLTDFTTGTPGALVDERALADGLNTGEYAVTPIIFNGEVEDHKIPVTTDLDYGDVPESYEYNNSGVFLPARHLPNHVLRMGSTVETEPAPNSVASGADNNGTNGDGLEEDGVVSPLPTLISGSEYSVLVNVTNNLTTAATLHGWIDFDGNGRFTSDEYTSVLIPANSGGQTAKLYWYTTSYTGTTANAYMRIRLTSASLADNPSTADVDERSIGDGLSTGLNAAYPINGEVEDYLIPVYLEGTQGEPQSCDPEDDRLGLMDPIQALFHGTIAKTANGNWLVWGANAHGNGTHQMTPAKLESGFNGYNFLGNPLLTTGASIYGLDTTHQYYLLTSTGLYVWGTSGIVIPGVPIAMNQFSLPSGVSPADVQMIDAGRGVSIGSLMLLTKTGEVWVYSNVIGSDVQGDGSIVAASWHQVMLDITTPLTGMKDVRTSGAAAIATDGNNFYTWGSNVFLGDGLQASNKSYATQMVTPTGITLPIKQQSINHRNNTAYYLRDGAGKVFVLGANEDGQLGLGNTSDIQNWLIITQMNEEPDAPGNQPDVTKPIKKVIWISANNHDSFAPLLNLITEDYRAYSTGNNDGNKSGTVSPTTRYLPTAVTRESGSRMVEGKMIFVASGGHISILVKEGSDRYAYVGHTIEGSDGCGGCTNSPTEYTLIGPPSTGPLCGNIAFDYGDLDDRYNLGDGASHEIKFSQNDNPLKLGSIAADSEDWAQFTITGSGNDAMGDDTDDQGDDEDAFTGTLPVKTAGLSYTLEVPLTNNTGEIAYLYGFIDWNNNGRFDPYEAVVEEVPSSETLQTVELTWSDDILIDCEEGEIVRSFVRLRLTTALLEDDTDTPEDERSFLAAPDGEVEDYYVDWEPDCSVCTIPGAGGTPDGYTVVGVSTHSELTSNWPSTVPNGWLAIESATKGFVITRVQNDTVITDPKPGMLIYDIDDDCVKLYRDGEWNCIERTCINVD